MNVEDRINKLADQIASEGFIVRASQVREAACEIARLRHMLAALGRHPDTPPLLKSYAKGELHG